MLKKLLLNEERRPAVFVLFRTLLKQDQEHMAKNAQLLVELIHEECKNETFILSLLDILIQELDGNTPLKAHSPISTAAFHHADLMLFSHRNPLVKLKVSWRLRH